MRPLYIKMSAFGPYAGYTEIPMEELGERGLYLITGDTGAGKTTIFDAICFALYGEASGVNRDASMFRSKYADESTPTEVELKFLHAGKEYIVKRCPEYLRPAKRGDKYTKQTAEAELHMPDGKVITKVKNVTQKIEALLGINKDQFSQIAMIAQGDFMKLLLADTKDRIEIFRKLFRTQNYRTLQERLDKEYKSVYGELQDGKKSIEQYISGIQADKDEVLSDDVKRAATGDMMTDDVIELLEKLNDKDTALKDKLYDELTRINNELEKVNNVIGAANALQNAKEALQKAEDRLLTEEPKAVELRTAFDKAKEELKSRDELHKRATQIETELPNYDAFDVMIVEVAKTKKEMEKLQKELEKEQKNREKEQSELEGLKNELSAIKDSGEEIVKLNNYLEKLNEESDALDELSENLDNYSREKTDLISAQERYLKKDNEFNKLNIVYETMEQRFRDGQAGLLAQKLKEGEKCPVCGATTHPHLAPLSDEVPTETELKTAKKAAEKARKEREASASETGGLKKALEEKERMLKKSAEKQLETGDLEEACRKIAEVIKACVHKKEKVKEDLEIARLNVSRKEKIEKDIPQKEALIREISETIEKLNASSVSSESKIKENEKQLEQLKKGLSFGSKDTAMSEKKRLNDEADELQRNYDKAGKQLEEENELILKLKAEIEGHKKTIKDSKVVDVDEENNKKVVLEAEQKECISKGETVASRIVVNERIRSSISKKSSDVSTIEKKLQWIRALADTANGRLSGKEKVMLETYIQMTYFDRIINRANLRFMTMSAGQYELIRMREADNAKSQSGLELNVIDHYNGSERSVKSLSGGESFMASLSLALGLSDEIQSSAGGIQIDTMFVDEGFGSLDSESLEQAYRALAGLTEGKRLVGIISHVADLKERIDKQVVVTKEKSGGSFVKLTV